MTLIRPEPTVVADANVLHANDQRNVLMTLATERQLDLRWTNEIETEWVHSLVRRMARKDHAASPAGPSVDWAGRFAATAKKMRDALPGHDIPDYLGHVGRVPGTDRKDQHVAAAAVCCAPSFLLTWNIEDFDADELADLGVTLTDPDAFLCGLFEAKPAGVHSAVLKSLDFVRRGYERRQQTPPTWEAYLDILATRVAPNALPRFATVLRSWVPDETEEVTEVVEAFVEADEPDEGGPGPGR